MMTVPHIGLKDPAERFTTFRAQRLGKERHPMTRLAGEISGFRCSRCTFWSQA
jgi:hypothetical protein